MIDQITTRSGLKLSIERAASNGRLEVSISTETSRPAVLHWGMRQDGRSGWQMPPRPIWPEGSTAEAGPSAVRTGFTRQNGASRIQIQLALPSEYSSIEFALLFPEESRWDSNDGKNYRIEIPGAPGTSSPATSSEAQPASFERVFPVEGYGRLAATVTRETDRSRLTLLAGVPGPLMLHWGVSRRSSQEWLLPAPSTQPPGTVVCQDRAAQTPFLQREDGMKRVTLEFPEPEVPLGVRFVLQQTRHGSLDQGSRE